MNCNKNTPVFNTQLIGLVGYAQTGMKVINELAAEEVE